MIEEFENNVDNALKVLKEISEYNQLLQVSQSKNEKIMLEKSIESLKVRLKLINKSIPIIAQQITLAQALPGSKTKEIPLENIKVKTSQGVVQVTLGKEYRKQFLEELRLSEESVKKISILKQEVKKEEEFQGSRFYLRTANKFFLDKSRKLIEKGNFNDLSKDLKKANMDILVEGYVSLIIFTSILVFILALGFVFFFTVFNFSPTEGFSAYNGNYAIRFAKLMFIPIILGIITFLAMYLYPKTEQSDIEKRIDQELPFAVVYMSAIAGSGIEPSAIFKIIAFSSEYPTLRKEVRKVLNQINIYGYDLVTALLNVAKNSPSKKLAELFSGLATTITSGGSLTQFFQKRAETLTMEYRLEREKFTKVAETSMDLYITVVIAAPMILLLIFVLLQVSDFAVSLSPLYLTFIIIGIIAVINVIFLSILQIKQPQY